MFNYAQIVYVCKSTEEKLRNYAFFPLTVIFYKKYRITSAIILQYSEHIQN